MWRMRPCCRSCCTGRRRGCGAIRRIAGRRMSSMHPHRARAMLYFAGLQNRKLLLAWENSPVRNRLMTPLSKYVRRLQEQGAVRRLDPDVLARAIMGSMLSLFSRNCVFSEMAIADPDCAETTSLVAILERRTRHS